MTPRQKWFVFDAMIDGFTIVVRFLKMIFNVQTPENIYDFAIWNDSLNLFTYDLKWQFSYIHTLNKKNSRPHQQFETTFPRLFFFFFGGGGGGIKVFTNENLRFHVSQKTCCLPRQRFPHAKLRNALFMLGTAYWFYWNLPISYG